MDRAVPFIKRSVASDTPFLAVIWPHTPHEKVIAGPEYQALYPDSQGKEMHYYGAITAFDDQMGRLYSELERLGVTQDTIIFFSSDNGPEHKEGPGVTGGLRGRKRSLYSGGGCVPAFAVWPGLIKPGSTIETPCSNLDYLPTLLDALEIERPDQRPMDGISILAILRGESQKRERAFPFLAKSKLSWITDRYKLITRMVDQEPSPSDELYDIRSDRSEKMDIASSNPELLASLKSEARQFMRSAKASFSGSDYNDPNYKPIGSWPSQKQKKTK
ncbi:MAG: sulfatase-like hydrolase/transferase [Opitutales bacterium]|nr:sulfatase-like hydrolase/transferase [Opitutales bacterium]